MNKYFCIILGAGPSGLSFAHTLLQTGISKDKILVIEQENEAGGLCRSQQVDGSPLDIGGGHFLDIRDKEVLDFLFQFMPQQEWNLFDRISTIRLHGKEVTHPLEGNLWQLPVDEQVAYLESIARAGSVQGTPTPEGFADWIRWKLGDRIADQYMLPYNSKIWSVEINRLGTYWLHKLPDVSFKETLKSCLTHSAQGTLPAHGKFYYPKQFGYGEVWRRMGLELGSSLKCGVPVTSVDVDSKIVNGQWRAQHLVSSIPWTIWLSSAELPTEIGSVIQQLISVAIDVDYVPETLPSAAHWTYEPDIKVAHHRLLLRSNFACNARGYWTETNAVRSVPTHGWRHRNAFAYPVNTLDKPYVMRQICEWAEAKGITPLGRWGLWEHMNSDVAVRLGREAALKTISVGAQK